MIGDANILEVKLTKTFTRAKSRKKEAFYALNNLSFDLKKVNPWV